MAGTYIEGISKVLSGVYTLIKAAVNRVAMGMRGVVAYPFTSDWGPVNVLTPVMQGGEFDALFNGSKTALTAGKIFKHAYRGLPQKVLAYRMATGTAAKASATLPGTGAPVLETLYPSTRAFTAVVKDGTSGGKVVEIIEAGVKLVSVEATTLAELNLKLNATDYVRVKTPGTNLPTNTAGVAFTGGNNGDAVTVTQYAAFLEEIEADGSANTFSLDGITDSAIITTVTDWLRRVRQDGVYITFVNGGPLSWDNDLAAANAQSTAFNHRAIINVGNGCEGVAAADMAIFIAARAASVPLNRTLTDEVVPYATVNKKLKPGQRVTAKEKGTLIFIQNGDYIEIDEAVNTLTNPPAGESAEFGKIRIHNALDQIARDLEAFGNAYKKDKSNTQEARETYAATVENGYLMGLAALEVIQPGYFYRPDPQYHGKDAAFKPKIDEAFFHADITPVDSMERIYQKIGVTF